MEKPILKATMVNQFREELPFQEEPFWGIETDGYGPFRGLHMHNGFEVGFVFAGEGTINLNGTEHTLKTNDVFFFDASVPHWHMNVSENRLKMFIIMFPAMMLHTLSFPVTDIRLLKPFLAVRNGFSPVLEQRHDLGNRIHDVVCLYQQRPEQWDLKSLPHIIYLLVEIACATHEKLEAGQPQFSSKIDTIFQALYYLNLHFRENFKVNKLANLCNLSTSRFSHLFTEIMRKSPLKYRDELRIAYAIEKMTAGNETLNRIADESGFSDAIQFSRIFKRITGHTPSDYRKRIQR